MNPGSSNTAIIILAAGKSARLGSPKQLLLFNEKTLLNLTVDAALETGCATVVVVLGANSQIIRKELKDKRLCMVDNIGWEQGMASSICCGLDFVINSKLPPDCVIFMVCDQPFVTGALINSLLKKNTETDMPIVASSYGDTIGTPALFQKSFFPSLMKLKGDIGAKKLISDNIDKVTTVQFPKGITDIDTAEDYELLIKEK